MYQFRKLDQLAGKSYIGNIYYIAYTYDDDGNRTHTFQYHDFNQKYQLTCICYCNNETNKFKIKLPWIQEDRMWIQGDATTKIIKVSNLCTTYMM